MSMAVPRASVNMTHTPFFAAIRQLLVVLLQELIDEVRVRVRVRVRVN